MSKDVRNPEPLRPLDWTGEHPPELRREVVPQHVAIVMDGNGRWANRQGLTRVEGHRAGEASLLDVVAGAVQIGVKHLSVYAFSTENWSRSPDEVRFLMGFNREVLRRRCSAPHRKPLRASRCGQHQKIRLRSGCPFDAQFAQRVRRFRRGSRSVFW